jgi:hypothetical protein
VVRSIAEFDWGGQAARRLAEKPDLTVPAGKQGAGPARFEASLALKP